MCTPHFNKKDELFVLGGRKTDSAPTFGGPGYKSSQWRVSGEWYAQPAAARTCGGSCAAAWAGARDICRTPPTNKPLLLTLLLTGATKRQNLMRPLGESGYSGYPPGVVPGMHKIV